MRPPLAWTRVRPREKRYSYDIYGTPTFEDAAGVATGRTSSAVGNPFLFTGHRWDPETRFYQARNNSLDPLTGRWIAHDRMGDDALGSLYAYAGGNPVNRVDSLGLYVLEPYEQDINAPETGGSYDPWRYDLEDGGEPPKIGPRDPFDEGFEEGISSTPEKVAVGAGVTVLLIGVWFIPVVGPAFALAFAIGLGGFAVANTTATVVQAVVEDDPREKGRLTGEAAGDVIAAAILGAAGKAWGWWGGRGGARPPPKVPKPEIITPESVEGCPKAKATSAGRGAKTRQELVDSLDKSPYRSTQTASKTDAEKIAVMAQLMRDGKWDWNDPYNKIIADSEGNVMDGHHRVIAAQQAGVDIPEGAIIRYPGTTERPPVSWDDTVPK